MSASLHPGQVLLGRYRLVRPLNEGGMSVVWAAEHTVTGKLVALKLLKSEAASDESIRRRMVREARAACAVVHPNILAIHDVLQLEDGSPVLVMDLLDGESLRDHLLRRPALPLGETATLLLPVISGVGTAHAAGIIHRDLKPENIFLSNEAGNVRVKVLDFGIAKLVGAHNAMTQSNALTNANTMLGTPYYMAPEQILCDAIDHRADIWSIGIILYECLAGERPTEAENVGRVLRRVIMHDFEPLASKVKGLPAGVTSLVDRMLSQEPKDRPASLHEVGEALAPHAAGVSLGAFGPPIAAPVSADISDERSAVVPPREGRSTSSGGVRRPDSTEYADTLIAARPSDPAPGPAVTAPARSTAVSRPAPAQSTAISATQGDAAHVSSRSAPDTRSVNTGSARPAFGGAALGVGALLGALGMIAYLVLGPAGARPPYVSPTATAADAAGERCPAGMGLVPGGAFRMGSNDGKADEQPVHEVRVATLCMDLTEVTADAYEGCVQRGGCKPAESTVTWQGIPDDVKNRESLSCTGYHSAKSGLPMNCISWDAADAFCRAAGKRLPSEAEWEHAAAGGSEGRPYPWGNAPPGPTLLNACDRSCADAAAKRGGEPGRPLFDADDGAQTLSPVGKYPLGDSRFGMHDMAGNVWEWTASPYCTYPEHACTSPYRVFRGGGWAGRLVTNMRVSARMWSSPAHRYNDVGFRCVKEAR